MAEPTAADPNLLQWALGALSAGALAVAGWIWNRIGGLETRMETRMQQHDAAAKTASDAIRTAVSTEMRDIWLAVTEERKATNAFRERILERMNDVPTKSDLRELKADIAKMLERQH